MLHHNAWFPDRLIGGLAFIAGPVVWCAGLLMRTLAFRTAGFTPAQLEAFDRQPFAAPAQLAAYEANPVLVTAGYALFVAGALLWWPAIATPARIVAARSPVLAHLGGALLIFGLFARADFAGVDQTAFQITAGWLRTRSWCSRSARHSLRWPTGPRACSRTSWSSQAAAIPPGGRHRRARGGRGAHYTVPALAPVGRRRVRAWSAAPRDSWSQSRPTSRRPRLASR